VAAEITITEDMLDLSAFKLQKDEEGSASLTPGQTSELKPITEFGANPYTEEDERSLSEIIDSFNDRHGTNFSREDFLRVDRVNSEIMDEDMTEMVKNNPADVSFNTFAQAFFQGLVREFQRDNEFRNAVMTDKDARDQMTKFAFKRAQRMASVA
jgi:type I restriction enzyme R subunit